MPISIAGSGTITGISAGGLPDDSIIAADIAAGAVTTAKIADANITAAKLDGAQSGSAPIYGARAWVNFNGTSTVAIRASGNVSSITDNGTGNYTVNFTTAMADAAYSALGNVGRSYSSTNGIGRDVCLDRYATTSIGVSVGESQTYVLSDEPVISISVFR